MKVPVKEKGNEATSSIKQIFRTIGVNLDSLTLRGRFNERSIRNLAMRLKRKNGRTILRGAGDQDYVFA